jgi:hypothetical protein
MVSFPRYFTVCITYQPSLVVVVVAVVVVGGGGGGIKMDVILEAKHEDIERARQHAMIQLTEGTVCTNVQSHLPCFF